MEVFTPKLPAAFPVDIGTLIPGRYLKEAACVFIKPADILCPHIASRIFLPVQHDPPVPVSFYKLQKGNPPANNKSRHNLENAQVLRLAQAHHVNFRLIDDDYRVEIKL